MTKHLLYFILLFPALCGHSQYQQFSSTRNSYGFYFSSNNCLTYNKDLNLLLFTQRLTADWPNSAFPYTPNPSGATGYLVGKWSSDNGISWDSSCYYQNDVHYPRYPSGVIYNPPGNTVPENAYMVGFGPTTSSLWDGMYFASSGISGSLSTINGMNTQTTNDQQWISLSGLNGADNIYLSQTSSTVTDSAVWICSIVVDANFDTKGIAIIKGVLNDSVFSWSLNTVIKNQWVINSQNKVYVLGDPQIAFQPNNPMVGYILVNGVDSLNNRILGKSSFTPMAWKTTDGGTSWNRISLNYDWKYEDICNNIYYSGINASDRFPSFRNSFGGEITVDSSGYLNYFTAFETQYSTDREQLDLIYPHGNYTFDTSIICEHPYLIHLRTNGNGWKFRMLDILRSRDLYTNESINPWSLPTGSEMPYHNRIQVSRTSDGSKLFVTWTDTEFDDATTSAQCPNIKPSISSIGFDVTTERYTNRKIIPWNNTNQYGFWWMYASDIAMDNSGTYTIPCVYASQNSYPFTTTARNNLYYINDLSFQDSMFNSMLAGSHYLYQQNCTSFDPFPYWCLLSVNQQKTETTIHVYPNPAADYLVIELPPELTQKVSVIRLYSSTGQLLKEEHQQHSSAAITIKTVDLLQGLYLLEIETPYGKQRTKIIKE